MAYTVFSGARPARRVRALAAAAAVCLAAAGTAWAEEGEDSGPTKVPTSACISGLKWTAGNEGSAEMHPGMSCIDCHAKAGGPKFIVAGTVYRQLNEPGNCYGVEGAVVQLTDAKGKVLKLKTNRAGNFALAARGNTIAFPFTAKVLFEGREKPMGTPQSSGNCLTCHTVQGVNGAPGRIIAP
jgi:hypothetical protein